MCAGAAGPPAGLSAGCPHSSHSGPRLSSPVCVVQLVVMTGPGGPSPKFLGASQREGRGSGYHLSQLPVSESESVSCSVVSALRNPVFCPSNSAGKSSGVDNHSLLPGIFPKEIAAHSSIHAWRISWTEEPVRLPSVGLQRVRHD